MRKSETITIGHCFYVLFFLHFWKERYGGSKPSIFIFSSIFSPLQMKTFPFLPWHNIFLLVLLCLAQWRMLMESASPVLPYFRSYWMVLSEIWIRLSTILPLQDTVVKVSCELDTAVSFKFLIAPLTFDFRFALDIKIYGIVSAHRCMILPILIECHIYDDILRGFFQLLSNEMVSVYFMPIFYCQNGIGWMGFS